MSFCFSSAEILLPDFEKVDGERYAVIACDQYTSEPQYWEAAERLVGNAPSVLSFVLPEVYLEDASAETRKQKTARAMKEALDTSLFTRYENAMIYLERTQRDGRVRCGVVGKIDLECYDYEKGSAPQIRATEGTVLSRIPPRAEVRSRAPFELPHVMLLFDDDRDAILSPLANIGERRAPIYDFDLMQGGGHVRGFLLTAEEQSALLARMAETLDEKFPFAVGDGNHSLAAAKAHYENLKRTLGADAVKDHPARYALVEAVNIASPALTFEPIYRVVFDAPKTILSDLRAYLDREGEDCYGGGEILCVSSEGRETVSFAHGTHSLTVGTLQRFLDAYLAEHKDVKIDYIHGEDSLTALAMKEGAVGFLFGGMEKSELFPSVAKDGALPRKTFSMGEAYDKRYYLEARMITR